MRQAAKRVTAVLLVMILFVLIPGAGLSHRAEASEVTVKEETYDTPKTGTIKVTLANTNALNAREDASSNSKLVEAIPNGTTVEVLGTKKYSNGKLWYKIRFKGSDGKTKEAYGFAEYIVIEKPKPVNEVYDSPRPAYVDYTPVTNVRSGPGQNYAMVKNKKGENATLINGTKVEALEYKNGYYKCNITIDGEKKVGYLYADFVRLYNTPSGDEEFVAQMKAQGFPDSYIESLRILHSQHPKWVFTADKTGLDWNTAVDEENVFGRSLVNYTSPTSWKRIDDLGYTFKTADNTDGGFKKLDGFHWEAANRVALAYFMDPRNFLTESEIFQFECQSYNPEIHTLERVQELLKGTFMSGDIPGEYMCESQKVNRKADGTITSIETVEKTSGTPLTYAEVFLMSAEISGVSPDMLVARVIQEMGTQGTSQIISGVSKTAPGHYNYYDFGTYATATADAITNGLIYAKKDDPTTCRPWNRRWKSLYGGAIMIGRDYISKGQDTLYYQKFNVKPKNARSLYTHQYMTNIQAPANEAKTMWQACPDLDTVIEFKIPVYKNMPESPEPYPEGSSKANPNPYLKSIEVEGFELTPEFDYKTFSYDLVVNEDTAEVNIKVETLAATAVAQSGTVQIAPGENAINILCTAAYGNSQNYVLNIYRPVPQGQEDPGQGDPEDPPEPKEKQMHIKTSYIVDEQYFIWGVEPETKAEDFLKNFVIPEGETPQILDKNKEPVADGFITTGTIIKTSWQEFTVIIVGDINKDGELSPFDLVSIKRYIVGLTTLDANAMLAADVRKDDEVDPFDLVYVKKFVVGLSKIEQPKGEEKTYEWVIPLE